MPMGWTKVADKNYYVLRLCRPFLDEVIAKTEWRSHSGSYFQEVLVDSVDALSRRLENQLDIRGRALDLKSRHRGDYVYNMSNMEFSDVRKRFETAGNLRHSEFAPLVDRFDVRLLRIIWRDAAVENENCFHRRIAIEIVERC